MRKEGQYMSYYSVNLPRYTIGEGCYREIPEKARFLGKTAVVIGGKTAMSKAKEKLLEGVKDSDVQILDFIWYGGDSTYENGNALMEQDVVKQADMILPLEEDVPVIQVNIWPMSWTNRCFVFLQLHPTVRQ